MGNIYGTGTEPSVNIAIAALNFLLRLTIWLEIFQHKEFVIPIQ